MRRTARASSASARCGAGAGATRAAPPDGRSTSGGRLRPGDASCRDRPTPVGSDPGWRATIGMTHDGTATSTAAYRPVNVGCIATRGTARHRRRTMGDPPPGVPRRVECSRCQWECVPVAGVTAMLVFVVRAGGRLRLHERLPRHRQLDRHVRRDAGPLARLGDPDGDRVQLHRRVRRDGGGDDDRQRPGQRRRRRPRRSSRRRSSARSPGTSSPGSRACRARAATRSSAACSARRSSASAPARSTSTGSSTRS